MTDCKELRRLVQWKISHFSENFDENSAMEDLWLRNTTSLVKFVIKHDKWWIVVQWKFVKYFVKVFLLNLALTCVQWLIELIQSSIPEHYKHCCNTIMFVMSSWIWNNTMKQIIRHARYLAMENSLILFYANQKNRKMSWKFRMHLNENQFAGESSKLCYLCIHWIQL